MARQYDLTINPTAYSWSARVITFLRKILKVNIKLHDGRAQLAAGDIFLFNHFARFETFIPQYLIYRETGLYCRSIADQELFAEGDAFSNYLLSIGAVPNNHPELLPFLAAEVLRGRKIVVFPEGGMVKDRRVVDETGRYSVYSRTANARRKHHGGAAVIAMAVEVFKQAVRRAERDGYDSRLDIWAESLCLPGRQALIAAAHRPTRIVPANITFYPMRVTGNLLQRGVELFKRGISRRVKEELLIEGNILLKHTDMDIRFGEPVGAASCWSWWERRVVSHLAAQLESLDQAFAVNSRPRRWSERLYAYAARRNTLRLRDAWMQAMYSQVTVNLSHLASLAIMKLLAANRSWIEAKRFHRVLYLAVKRLQASAAVHLHRSLRDPDAYEGLLDGRSEGFSQFLQVITGLGLMQSTGDTYRLSPKLAAEYTFDAIRLENPVAVYANEVKLLATVERAVDQAIAEAERLQPAQLALLQFDDERLALAWDRQLFARHRHLEINRQQTATADPEPFFFRPARQAPLGLVLVHGFLASPAEVRGFGERLHRLGYPVIGVRLKGHGTSPWDLHERSRQDWLESVRRGCAMIAPFAARVGIVGFSAGGVLALRLAAEPSAALAGVVAVAAPLRFVDRNIKLVPLVQGVNRLVQSVSPLQGVMPFNKNAPENPHINYAHMPVRSLHELSRLVDDTGACLADVRCPVLLVQGTDDPVVAPASADLILERLGSLRKQKVMVSASCHGILYRNSGKVQEQIITFLNSLTARREVVPALPDGRPVYRGRALSPIIS